MMCALPVYFTDAATEHEGTRTYFLLCHDISCLGSGNLEVKRQQ